MALNIFANVNQTVEPDIATDLRKTRIRFEMEGRERRRSP